MPRNARPNVAPRTTTSPAKDRVPEDLAQALAADASARAAFEALPPSHRREYIRWIEEARKVETRRARIQRTVARVATRG